MTWEEFVDAVISRYPDVTLGRMFGLPCLTRGDGSVAAARWKGGGITVKLTDDSAREAALALPGAEPGSHAFDPSRPMRRWVHLSDAHSAEWLRLIDLALTVRPQRRPTTAIAWNVAGISQ
jgi:hypothetical protein